ncbi:MAG: hypothetical protein ABI564_18565 [Ideonella sp.]
MTDLSIAAPLIDLVIGVTLVEALALLLVHYFSGKGVAPLDFLANMVSGLCLMLALRSSVRDAGVAWLALFLLAAGVAHGIDILMRWRRRTGSAAVDRRMVA